MEILPQVIVNGVVAGTWFAAIGVGFVLLYRSTGIFNFAQGQFILVGAYLFITLSRGLPPLPAFLLAVLLTAVLGALTHVVLIQRMIGRDVFSVVILTLGLGILIDGLAGYLWGPTPIPVKSPVEKLERLQWLGVSITTAQVVNLLITGLFFALMLLFLQRSKLGLRMRATAENPLLANLTGIPVMAVYIGAWALAGVAGAIAGITFSQQQGVATLLLPELGLLAFPAIILGGLDSIDGALVGGLVVGVLSAIVITYFDAAAQFAVSYAVLLLVLIVRPSGLFGSEAIQRL